MGKVIDITGQRFGKLIVLYHDGFEEKQRLALWRCVCDCGKATLVQGARLRSGHTKSCGCLRKADLIGQRFGQLTILRYKENRGKARQWVCLCDCGGKSIVQTGNLVSGHSKTCGCGNKKINRLSMTSKSEYASWYSMLMRCTNVTGEFYKHYGGRGIEVCNRWKTFELFIKDMGYKPGKNHSIERLDNNGDYEPGNCVWATQKTQARNTRRNFVIEYKGEKKCLAEWCEIFGIEYGKAWRRLRLRNWSPERAFTE